jgi:hypothetical protein
MTPESMVALGARLLLMQRYRLPMQLVAAMTDEAAVAAATVALNAADRVGEYVAGGAR